MICLADTDVVLKLAACNLLKQSLEVLGVTRQEVYIFREEAYFVYRYSPKVLDTYPEVARRRALMFINSVHNILVPATSEEQAYMQHAGIDAGEQAIFGATREYQDFQVITADRKALRALAHADGCGGICARMNGRVVSMEQILLRLIAHIGFATLQAQVLPCASYDVAFELPFAAGNTQAEAETQLCSRLALLREQTRDLLSL